MSSFTSLQIQRRSPPASSGSFSLKTSCKSVYHPNIATGDKVSCSPAPPQMHTLPTMRGTHCHSNTLGIACLSQIPWSVVQFRELFYCLHVLELITIINRTHALYSLVDQKLSNGCFSVHLSAWGHVDTQHATQI